MVDRNSGRVLGSGAGRVGLLSSMAFLLWWHCIQAASCFFHGAAGDLISRWDVDCRR